VRAPAPSHPCLSSRPLIARSSQIDGWNRYSIAFPGDNITEDGKPLANTPARAAVYAEMGSNDWQKVRDAGHCSNDDPGWTTERLIDDPDKPGTQIPDPDEQSPIRIPQIFTYPSDPGDSSKGCDLILHDPEHEHFKTNGPCVERDPPGKWGPDSVGWDPLSSDLDEAGLPSGRPSRCDPLPGAGTWVSKSNEDYDKCMDDDLQESYSSQRSATTDLMKRKAKCLWSRSEKHLKTLEPNEKNMTMQDTDADWRYSRDPDYEGDVPGLLRLQHPEVRTYCTHCRSSVPAVLYALPAQNCWILADSFMPIPCRRSSPPMCQRQTACRAHLARLALERVQQP
jgi:hypothetical protein